MYARLQKFLRQRVINIYVAKIANIRENCANKYAKAREP